MCKVTYHTGEPTGHDNTHCARCGSSTPGERWEWFVMMQKKVGAAQKLPKGLICESCVDEINHDK